MMKKGFTLIELVVVISVIAVIVSLLPVSYKYIFNSSRDTVRKNELKQYQIALENYSLANEASYPSSTQTVRASVFLCNNLSLYLQKCPEDAKYSLDNSFSYNYQSSLNGLNWVLWSRLEKEDNVWVICSDRKAGEKSFAGFAVVNGVCPL